MSCDDDSDKAVLHGVGADVEVEGAGAEIEVVTNGGAETCVGAGVGAVGIVSGLSKIAPELGRSGAEGVVVEKPNIDDFSAEGG